MSEVIHPVGTKVRFTRGGREGHIREIQADPDEVRYAIDGFGAWYYFPEDFEVVAPPTPEIIAALKADYFGGDLDPDGEDLE